ncbi:MAG: peptide ABC transporter substrate-binding protein [Puniceicoccaceae bacterium]
MKRTLIFIGAVSMGCLFSGCGGPVEQDGNVLRIGNGGEPRDLDPHTITGVPEAKIIFSLMEGLLAYHPTDDEITYPGIAESWDVSEDGMTWHFHLRESKWSNGDPLTAEDFVYSWRRVLHPGLGNEYADWMYMIKGAEAYHKGEMDDIEKIGVVAESEYVLRVELVHPVANFLKMLLNHTFLPVHKPTIEAFGGAGVRQSGWTQPESYIGNGAYVLKSWEPNSVIRIERNPNYWDAASVRMDAIEWYPIQDPNTELRAFESGQLHVTTTVPVNQRNNYRKNFPDKIRFDAYAGVYFYRINTLRAPLDDVRVRKALSLSIDRGLIIRSLLQGNERVATGYAPGGIGCYDSPPREVYNPDKARAYLAEAGYPGGSGFPEVELLFNTSDNHRKIAEAIQSMWRNELGVEISLTNQEWKVYLDTTKEMQYDIARAGWIGNLYPYSFMRTLLSYSPNNDTGFANSEYDALLEESAQTMDQEKRHELVRRAEDIMLAEEPVIPLYWYTNVYLIDPRVKNWTPKLVDQRPMKFVYLEN